MTTTPNARVATAPLAVAALLAAGALLACAGDEGADASRPATDTTLAERSLEPPDGGIDLRDVPWAVNLGVDLDAMIRRPSGLYVQVLAEGRGPQAAPGDSMRVHYRVWLPSGRQIDASYDHDPPAPLDMVLGETPLIDGWVEGVTGMRVGERRRLVIPYRLAYGPQGHPAGIPPYSPLVYEVELVGLTQGGS